MKRAGLLAAACFLLGANAPPPSDHGDFAGRWFFSTNIYNNSVLSGYAIATPMSGERYAIKLTALWQSTTKDGQLAHETCIGRWVDDELKITCSVDDSTRPTYSPDSFMLESGHNAWIGTFSSNGNSKVIFMRI